MIVPVRFQKSLKVCEVVRSKYSNVSWTARVYQGLSPNPRYNKEEQVIGLIEKSYWPDDPCRLVILWSLLFDLLLLSGTLDEEMVCHNIWTRYRPETTRFKMKRWWQRSCWVLIVHLTIISFIIQYFYLFILFFEYWIMFKSVCVGGGGTEQDPQGAKFSEKFQLSILLLRETTRVSAPPELPAPNPSYLIVGTCIFSHKSWTKFEHQKQTLFFLEKNVLKPTFI